MESEGEAQVQGNWASRTVGLDGIRCDIAMTHTPDRHARLEPAMYHNPKAIPAAPPPPNTVGPHRVMLAVDRLDDTTARPRPHGAEPRGDVARYEDTYRPCYLRGPEGIIVALAEQIG